jgi:hypothetical protein
MNESRGWIVSANAAPCFNGDSPKPQRIGEYSRGVSTDRQARGNLDLQSQNGTLERNLKPAA